MVGEEWFGRDGKCKAVEKRRDGFDVQVSKRQKSIVKPKKDGKSALDPLPEGGGDPCMNRDCTDHQFGWGHGKKKSPLMNIQNIGLKR